ncbi:MAG TPA: ABC transporter permease, partial [Kofleriaceae bacterium]|nr:ABC transporter permease [Kofleriaceae bacterium]
MPELPASRRALIEFVVGAALIVAGAVTIVAVSDDSAYVIGGAPIFAGLVVVLHAMTGLAGYKAFVAWRYLLNHRQRVTRRTKIQVAIGGALYLAGYGANLLLAAGEAFSLQDGFDSTNPLHLGLAAVSVYLLAVVVGGVLRYSRPAMVVFFIGLGIGVCAGVAERLVADGKLPFFVLEGDARKIALQVLGFVKLGGAGGLSGLALFFGCLRAFFTFFTTVPIGGVWIGTGALVMVLSVMSGFENDLRDKILGSNAHIQITREDGEFVAWREVKAKIDAIPGVVASTPYAVSEVVIAANNNGMNVIIKGIDPATVGAVTDLISDLEDSSGEPDPEAMQRLYPLVKSTHDRSVPQTPRPQDVLDPPPDDMPVGGDPIDF